MSSAGSRFLVIQDTLRPCSYLPGRSARQPLRLPLAPLTPEAFDAQLAEGDRRAGPLLYRTACPACSACEALRVPVGAFVPTRSQQRVLRRNGDLDVEVGPPVVDAVRLELFNRHSRERGLGDGDDLDADGYFQQFAASCVDTSEVRYLVGGRLVAVSILDFGRRAASSVYHYFDPDESARSLGVYSVLREIELCRGRGVEWYYLGYWVGECRHLRYKARYRPHERLVGGAWVPAGAADGRDRDG